MVLNNSSIINNHGLNRTSFNWYCSTQTASISWTNILKDGIIGSLVFFLFLVNSLTTGVFTVLI